MNSRQLIDRLRVFQVVINHLNASLSKLPNPPTVLPQRLSYYINDSVQWALNTSKNGRETYSDVFALALPLNHLVEELTNVQGMLQDRLRRDKADVRDLMSQVERTIGAVQRLVQVCHHEYGQLRKRDQGLRPGYSPDTRDKAVNELRRIEKEVRPGLNMIVGWFEACDFARQRAYPYNDAKRNKDVRDRMVRSFELIAGRADQLSATTPQFKQFAAEMRQAAHMMSNLLPNKNTFGEQARELQRYVEEKYNRASRPINRRERLLTGYLDKATGLNNQG